LAARETHASDLGVSVADSKVDGVFPAKRDNQQKKAELPKEAGNSSAPGIVENARKLQR